MKKTHLLFLLTIIIVFFSNNICFGRYFEMLKVTNYSASIAEPIFKVIPQQETNVFKAEKNNINKEYLFSINNYENKENSIRISEVDLKYDIEILLSNKSFPIKLKLYDCSSDKEIELDNSNKTESFIIEKNILFEKQYKLVAYWNEELKLSKNIDIEIKVNASQNN